jgi:hypothetical protein
MKVMPCLAAVDRQLRIASELLGSGERSEASGDFLAEFDHADVAFGAVVVR